MLDVLDFNRSCEEARGTVLPLSGVPVWYFRCGHCGFIFTEYADAWTAAEFSKNVYNSDYTGVDPDWADVRPRYFADLVWSLFGDRLRSLRVLDYGAGSGAFVDHLAGRGVDVSGFDPFARNEHLRLRPCGRFELIGCFEVLEHSPFPRALLSDLDSLLSENGLILLSTTLSDGKPTAPRLTWPYAAPRNGHFSLFSARSLELLFADAGYRVGSFDGELHAAIKAIPSFAGHLFERKAWSHGPSIETG
ncbi:MAG: class I SAM-dependent methyltransferase [Proteobacteria bacterium]|nr:class I SAM-dependent methyltransferase [Pseudomonadota bacterium]